MEVTATDGANTDSQTITVTVTNDNDNPVITSSDTVNAAENQTAVTTVTATDADGTSPTFSITGGADAALFSIDANTGVLTFNAAPDYENPADANTDNNYIVQVTASDGTTTDVQTITVSVTNVNDTLELDDIGFDIDERSENGTVVGTLSASGTGSSNLSYSIIAGNTNGCFVIDPDSGQITVANGTALNYYENPEFSLTVRVTDNDAPGLTETAVVTIIVNELPGIIVEPPVVSPTDNPLPDDGDGDTTPPDNDPPGDDDPSYDTEDPYTEDVSPEGTDEVPDVQDVDPGTENNSTEGADPGTGNEPSKDGAPGPSETSEEKDNAVSGSQGDTDSDNANSVIELDFKQISEGTIQQLDQFIDVVNAKNNTQIRLGTVKVGATFAVVGTFSAGYLAWMLQGGALVVSMVSSMPVWQSFDPLTILESHKIKSLSDEDDETEERIESLLK